ncbi:catalase [Hymenobacter daecheongensis DSM 21074]|uniref:Catalase n=1 Tax=Hymenobacter daecheongensis DSM 21074 TaxID=1121955 RepID=A0A1M6JTZ8_9BACT|nr:catalase [Hymenobacter daecheongensis]SHJ50214.1 catalase [Hymenobacter daecheongensis DSM 21074]
MAKSPKSNQNSAPAPPATNAKLDELNQNREDSTGQLLTSNQGLRVNDDQNSLKAGERGPTLLEDFLLREKITHFDHERIPERVVHARGVAAHGYFEAYDNASQYSKAAFLQPGVQTPIFTRFSTVAGFRGSTDMARDVRGFAVKFYTQEGIYDFVGNNIPVFFIQDAIKFPDLIHAVKPEPHNEIPQAASAHNTFWDFISANPESMHMVLWTMSDRAIPRNLRMMEGFNVHTWRLIDAQGKSRFVKFHWKPKLGIKSVVWDEALQISGKDPDFHRRDLWENIEAGNFPEWELGVQVVEEEDEFKFDFDLLDATKVIPEELVPVTIIGRMVLNRNPDNYFAETEQVAFHPGHIVPGIDFTNDPLLQGRLFSYTDTQLTRLGSPNFHEIPINRSIAPIHNNQRDGHMRQQINVGKFSYGPNLLHDNAPRQAKQAEGGFVSHNERVEAHKVRARSKSFVDHYSQARLFWNSQAEIEKVHIIKALRFELGKVEAESVRKRMLLQLSLVADELASRVAKGLGLEVPSAEGVQLNYGLGADADVAAHQSKPATGNEPKSAALSIENHPLNAKKSIATKQVAILAADGADAASIAALKKALEAGGATAKLVAPHLGHLRTSGGEALRIDFSLQTTASVLFDGVYVAGGEQSVQALLQQHDALHFVNEAYRHCKPVGAAPAGKALLSAAAYGGAKDILSGDGVSVGDGADKFVQDLATGRFWSRELKAEPKV